MSDRMLARRVGRGTASDRMSAAVLRLTTSAILLLLALVTTPPAAAAPAEIRIGVLAFRPVDQTLAQWTPTAEYLDRAVPGQHFVIVPLVYANFDAAVYDGKVDFALTNPEHYVILRARYGLSAMLTLMPRIGGHPVNSFGGVIVTRSGRSDIRALADLQGKTIASPGPASLGGYLAQRWEMSKAGIAPGRFVFVGMPHDKAITTLLDGRADAAFARTGVLEGMIAEGTVKAGDVRVVSPTDDPPFPQIRSTALYPEWPLVALNHVQTPLVKAVSLALLELAPTDPAAVAGGYYGFAPPGDYSSVEAVMIRLRVNPDRFDYFDWRDFLAKYSLAAGLAGAVLGLGAVGAITYLWRVNRRLSVAVAESQRLAATLASTVEKLEDTNAELERFGVVAAHDLQEPARNIVSFLQLLQRRCGDAFDQNARDYMTYASDAARRMKDMVGDLSDYTGIARLGEEMGPVDCGPLVARSVERLSDTIAATGAQVTVGPMPQVLGSARLLEQMFGRLLDNALEFRGDRPPDIHVDAEREGPWWHFRVADNGIGIDPQYHRQIFSVFTRLHGGELYPGTGMGLAVCRRVVVRHGGQIWVDSSLGAGSVFHVRLKAADQPAADAPA